MPLTNDQLWASWLSCPTVAEGEDDSMESKIVAFARAVERAAINESLAATPQPSADMVLVPPEWWRYAEAVAWMTPGGIFSRDREALIHCQGEPVTPVYAAPAAAPKLATTAQPAAPTERPDTKRLAEEAKRLAQECADAAHHGDSELEPMGKLHATIDRLAALAASTETGEEK